jgi:hypothetical protein
MTATLDSGLQPPKGGSQKEHRSRGRAQDEASMNHRAPTLRLGEANHKTVVFRPYHSIAVPRQADLEDAFWGNHDADSAVTTLMLRHIPNKYTQMSLIQELELQGFEGSFDFFYMPMDVHNRANVGYAFINFVKPEHASRFFQHFSYYRFRLHPSSKIGAVSPAHLQGLAANVYHFANRAVVQSKYYQYRPIVIRDGEHLDISVVMRELQAGDFGSEAAKQGDDRQEGRKAAAPQPQRKLKPEALAAANGQQ